MYSMEIPTLEQVVRQYVPLPPRPNGRGFFPVLCRVCNDHGKKGKRAGFKFEGSAVGYNCFNCGHTAVFDPTEHTSMPSKMAAVLEAFNIPEVDWRPVLFGALKNKDGSVKEARPTFKDIEPDEVKFPPSFYRLTDDATDEWAQWAIEYLTEDRGIDWKSHPFYLVRKTTEPDNTKWYGRLIIPVYKDDKLIFWQGRDLTGLLQKKYMSPDFPREKVMSGFDRIQEYSDTPLYIMEGWFDAYWLNGVAIFGNKMTPEQIKWLNRTNRPKVIIPDRMGDGQILAEQALELGWSVSTPEIGECKDINDAVKKYGHLYTVKTVKDNIRSGLDASVRVSLWCESREREKKKQSHRRG